MKIDITKYMLNYINNPQREHEDPAATVAESDGGPHLAAGQAERRHSSRPHPPSTALQATRGLLSLLCSFLFGTSSVC